MDTHAKYDTQHEQTYSTLQTYDTFHQVGECQQCTQSCTPHGAALETQMIVQTACSPETWEHIQLVAISWGDKQISG